MRRIIFVNLHCNNMIVKDLKSFLFSKSVATKHRFILDYLLKRKEYEVYSFVNSKGGSFAKYQSGIIHWIFSKTKFLEHKLVMRLNHISGVKILDSLNQLSANDIVIYNDHFLDQFYDNENILACKIVSLIHFYGDIDISNKIRALSPNAFFAEVDLRKTSLMYRKNFSWFKEKFFLLPFSYQARFVYKKKFKDRFKRAVAMGTVTKYDNEEFMELYGTNCYQPMRKQIYDNKKYLDGCIDCLIMPYDENGMEKKVHKSDSLIKKYVKLFNNLSVGQQKKYFSFDIVDKYNAYQMAIVPEDIHGMIGIGMVECMACGCAFIGLDYVGYKDIGMISGKHFIGYDGTIKNLKEKVEYYITHQDELEKIAKSGYQYIKGNFSENEVANKFIENIEAIAKDNKNIHG